MGRRLCGRYAGFDALGNLSGGIARALQSHDGKETERLAALLAANAVAQGPDASLLADAEGRSRQDVISG